MSGILGTTGLGGIIPGSLCGPAPRKLCVNVDGPTTIGFRTDGRLIVLHATRRSAELRQYGSGGKLTVLGQYAGARQIACEDTGARLMFFVDGNAVFELPKGRERWEIYSGA